MRPHLLKIALAPEHSFNVRHDSVPHFYNKWHYHPEIELVHIIRGSGTQCIGDNIHRFKNEVMLLLGSNLPHLWRSDKKVVTKKSDLKIDAIVIHFTVDCFGDHFFELPENREMQRLFKVAQQGIRVRNNTRGRVAPLIKELVNAKGTQRIILLLQILNIIARSKENRTVCSKGSVFQYHPSEIDRLDTIYQYILDNFSKDITLKQIAAVAHLTPHAFCRYLKSRIKKSFSTFLKEVRVGHACKLLAETDKSVAQVCYESGFNNFSNFNRHFKSLTGKTPLAHRNYYRKSQLE